MTEELIVTLERDPPVVPAPVPCVVATDAVITGVVARTETLQRFTCGQGCGFVINVN